MAELVKGTKVVIVSGGNGVYHYFENGAVVTFDYSSPFGDLFRGTVYADDGVYEDETQYLLTHHYKLYEGEELPDEVKVSGEIPEKNLPSKVIYGVINAKDEVQATTSDRDHARDLKSMLGGKRKGVRIFAYTASKEIR